MDTFLLLAGISLLIVAIAYAYTIVKGVNIMKKQLDDLKDKEGIKSLDKEINKIKKFL